ncbi:MAG: hypothetical protein Q8R78_03710, partial [Candidatus Omnitrophota bacterium]|nr:hypothetical protein [Candidatus Omnitrophota bacterium]
GITPSDVGLAVQLTRITKGDRSPLANPEGFTAETAQTQLGYLTRRLGPEKAAAVERAAQGIRTWFRGLTAKYPGLFTPEQRQAMAENAYYAPFQVIDYLENWISAGFVPQEGTFKSIRNPFDSLVLKGVAVVVTGEKNRITAGAMHGLLPYTTEADGLLPAPVTMLEGHIPHVRHKTGYDAILWKEDGAWKAAYAEPTIAKSFNRPDNAAMGLTAQVLEFFLRNTLWRKVLITLSPGFQSVNVAIRDPGRSWVNLGLIPFKGYGKAWPMAKRRARGQYDPVIQRMLREGALQPLFNELIKGKTEFETELEAQLAKYGGADTEAARTMIQRLFGWFELWGNVFESLPKIAGWRQLRAHQLRTKTWDAEARAYQTRTYLGTPTRRPGEGYLIYNNVWLFSEMFKEGWRSDAELAFHPKTRVGWWLRSLLISVVPVIASLLAAAGYFGPKIRKRMDESSEYLKTNYHVIPLGEDALGKAALLTLALPDTQRFLHGLAWKILSPLIDSLSDLREGKTPRVPDYSARHLEQLFAFGAGALPSPAPMLEWYLAAAAMLTGGTPRDWFRDQDILTKDERAAGGWEAWRPFLKWTVNQTGFTKMSLHTQPGSEDSLLERTTTFAPGLNRFLRVTDYGATEQFREATERVASEEARTRLGRKRQIIESLQGGENEWQAIKRWSVPRDQEDSFKEAFRRMAARKRDDPLVSALLSASSNEQKAAVLEHYYSGFESDAEFEQAINTLRLELPTLISRDVLDRLKLRVKERVQPAGR